MTFFSPSVLPFRSLMVAVATAVIVALAACGDIAEADRYLPIDTVAPVRAVLVEEFTGQLCSNCPLGHATLNALRAQYGAAVIAVSIHGGPAGFMFPESSSGTPPYVGLNNALGNYYAAQWGVASLPTAVVDRRGGCQERQNWAAAVTTALARPTTLALQLTATAVDGDSLSVAATMVPQGDLTGRLQLWVVEDGVRAVQLDGNNTVADYDHHHVLRAAVNGSDGEAVTLAAQRPQTVVRTVPLSSGWTTDSLVVVAFVYNDAEGVVQAAEVPVVHAAR